MNIEKYEKNVLDFLSGFHKIALDLEARGELEEAQDLRHFIHHLMTEFLIWKRDHEKQ